MSKNPSPKPPTPAQGRRRPEKAGKIRRRRPQPPTRPRLPTRQTHPPVPRSAKNLHYRISDAYYIWGRATAPGQRIIHETCHIFDILRFFTDSEVTSVYCIASRPDDESICLQFANGCVAGILSSGYVTYDMPKETLQAVVDIGGLTVSDFVELRTYGLKDFDRVYRFAGHTHPDRDTFHRYLFEFEGEQAMLNIRRMFWEKWGRLEQLKAKGARPQAHRTGRFSHPPRPPGQLHGR